MKFVTVNKSRLVSNVRRVTEGGRTYLVAPLTMIVPGVLAGSSGALYYPPEEVARNHSAWDGTPLVLRHPSDPSGNPLSARDPAVVARFGMGEVRSSRVTSKTGSLVAEGWFDEKKTRRLSPQVYTALLSGGRVELSTGLFTKNTPSPGVCPRTGRAYTHVASRYRPDHLAVLPDERGACSLADGCGVNVVANSANRHRDELGRFASSTSSRALRKSASLNSPYPEAHKAEAAARRGSAGHAARFHAKAADRHLSMVKVTSGSERVGHRAAAALHKKAQALHRRLVRNSNPEGCNQYTGRGCSHAGHAALVSGARLDASAAATKAQFKSGEALRKGRDEQAEAHADKARRLTRRALATSHAQATAEHHEAAAKAHHKAADAHLAASARHGASDAGVAHADAAAAHKHAAYSHEVVAMHKRKPVHNAGKKGKGSGGGRWVTLDGGQHVYVQGGKVHPGGPGSKPVGGKVAREGRKKAAEAGGLSEQLAQLNDKRAAQAKRQGQHKLAAMYEEQARKHRSGELSHQLKSTRDLPKGTHNAAKVKRGTASRLAMSPDKACQILKDGSVQGHPLSVKQKRLFGIKCGQKSRTTNALPVPDPDPDPTPGGSTMRVRQTDKGRRAARFLTANCSCWEGKEEALLSLPEDVLLNMARREKKALRDAAVANAARTGFEDPQGNRHAYDPDEGVWKTVVANAAGGDDDVDDVDEEVAEETVRNKGGKPKKKGKTQAAYTEGVDAEGKMTGNSEQQGKGKKLTREQWEALAPDDVLEEQQLLRNTAVKVKGDLVRRLVANVGDERRRKDLAEKYAKKPLAELQELVSLLPENPDPRRSGRSLDESVVDFALNGVGAPTASGKGGFDEDDVWEMPTGDDSASGDE